MEDLSRRKLLKGGLATAGAGALAALGGQVQAYPAPKADVPIETFDTVVIGAGCAGLVCAIEAHDRGGKSVVIEKMGRPAGNAIFALGSVNVTGTRFQKEQGVADDPLDVFYKDMMAVSLQRADPELTRYYVDHGAEAAHWLADEIGVKFMKIDVRPYPRFGRTHRVDGEGITGGAMLVRRLLEAAKKRNIPIYYHTKAVELLTNDKLAVTGVRTKTENGMKDIHARGGVVIASGGFSANREMLTMYMGGWAALMPTRGSPYVTGENISLTKPLFAQLVNMDQFHGGPIVSSSHANPADLLNSGYGVIVSLKGKRIIDEAETYVIKAKMLPKLVPENFAWQIIDSDTNVLKRMVNKFTQLNSTFYKADTIEDLAKQMGLPVDAVVASVNGYNDAVKSGKTRELSPPNTLKMPHPVAKAPFYAFPFEGGMTATFGGPKINTQAEVVNMERQPIPGLYAAGNAAGGLFYNNYIGGAQLAAATIFGRVAGQQTVERSKKEQ